MIVRVWRTGVRPGRLDGLVRFAHERSLPMFRSDASCLGVVFAGGADAGGFVTITLWPDADAIASFESSESYRRVVAEIMSSGLLAGEQTTEAFEVRGGWLSAMASDIRPPDHDPE